MNYKIKNIIKAANLAYSEGGVYVLCQEDLTDINKILGLELTENHLVDSVYDIIYAEAKKKWPNDRFFKELQAENSGYGKEIIHAEPMGSMDELKTGDWDKWKVGHHRFLLSEKLDGCSIILTYRAGKLYSAATRGRGIKGKDIMRHIPFISNIPQEISYVDELVVRGELLCLKDEIPEMLKEVAETEEILKTNPSVKKQKKLKTDMEYLNSLQKKLDGVKQLQNKHGDTLPLAAAFFIKYRDQMFYLVGASEYEYRTYKGPYAIQWHMIRKAKQLGCTRYNFYGISGYFKEGEEGYGVFDFKRGFNAVVEEYIGNFILPVKPAVYNIYNMLKKQN